jgi:hypothetical protein
MCEKAEDTIGLLGLLLFLKEHHNGDNISHHRAAREAQQLALADHEVTPPPTPAKLTRGGLRI